MKNRSRSLDRNMILTSLVVIGLSTVCFYHWEFVSDWIKQFLCAKLPKIIIATFITFVYLAHFFKFRVGKVNSPTLLSKSLPPFLDNCFSAFTYITIISTSLTLMKGLFLQEVFNEEYFRDFGIVDSGSLAVVLFILLWYSVKKIGEDSQGLFYSENLRNLKTKDGERIDTN